MQVPQDLKINKYLETENKHIFISRFIQNMPSKIYTEVKENLLVIILKGQKKLIYKDYETTVREGEFAFFHKGNYIMNQILSQSEYESLLIFISDDFINKIRRNTIEKQYTEDVPFFRGNVVSYMNDEIVLLMKLLESKAEGYDEVITLKIMELFTYILLEDKSGQFNNFLNTFSKDEDFKSYMINHVDQYDNIITMAKEMNMSISTFKRKFYHSFQVTPHKWMSDIKLEKARMLVDTSDYSITDICFICGFESISTFISSFKKKYGVSPGKYRR